MSNLITLFTRNRQFSDDFKAADLPVIPKLRTVVLTCAEPRRFWIPVSCNGRQKLFASFRINSGCLA